MKIPTMNYISRVHQNIFIQWEPSVAQGTHNYSHCLPALCRKLRFELFSPMKVDPLSLLRHTYTQLRISKPSKENFRGSPELSKFEANRSRGSWVIWSNIKTNKQRLQLYIHWWDKRATRCPPKVAEQYEIGFFESGPFQKLYIKHV